MSDANDHHVTRLLARVRSGEGGATGELLNAAYADLRALAATLFRDENPGHTLQPTALVNELCVQMSESPGSGWVDRNHFFRAAARAMRHLLVDHARAKNALRRGGDGSRVSLDSLGLVGPSSPIDLVALDETIDRLTKLDERLGMVFELRFLVGLNVEQTATVAGISARSVEQDSQFIRAWLHRELAS